MSPSHPAHYGTNLDCEYNIVGPQGHYLIFSFEALDLPRAYNCSTSDYVQLFEANATDPILGTFCGTDAPPNVETFGNVAKLTFHTDGNQGRDSSV
jgi:cubilin